MKRNPKQEIKEAEWLVERLNRLKGLKASLSPGEVETVLTVLREYCLARAEQAISADAPLDDQAWRAVSIAGQLQDQAHKDQLHQVSLKRESAGLDGVITIRFEESISGETNGDTVQTSSE